MLLVKCKTEHDVQVLFEPNPKNHPGDEVEEVSKMLDIYRLISTTFNGRPPVIELNCTEGDINKVKQLKKTSSWTTPASRFRANKNKHSAKASPHGQPHGQPHLAQQPGQPGQQGQPAQQFQPGQAHGEASLMSLPPAAGGQTNEPARAAGSEVAGGAAAFHTEEERQKV